MLDEILGYVNNWFYVPRAAIESSFSIINGELTLPLLDGQYFKIEGSVFNDGVHQYPASDLTDETFTGVILPMAVPKAFLSLVDEVEAWQNQHGSEVTSPYQSESFGGYSYSKGGSASGGSAVNSWQDAFKSRLSRWRKL